MSLVTPRKGYKSVPWLFGKEIEIPEEWEVKKIDDVFNQSPNYQKDRRLLDNDGDFSTLA